VKVTLVLGEPKVGSAVLVTNILASWARTSAEELEVTFWPCSGFARCAHFIDQSLGTDNGTIDMGYDLQRLFAAR